LSGARSGDNFKPDLYVVARMIERIIKSRDGKLKRTQLQMKSGLNWNVFVKYLNLLVEKRILIIMEDPEGIYVTTTQEGRAVYRDLLESIRQIMGEKWMEDSRRPL